MAIRQNIRPARKLYSYSPRPLPKNLVARARPGEDPQLNIMQPVVRDLLQEVSFQSAAPSSPAFSSDGGQDGGSGASGSWA